MMMMNRTTSLLLVLFIIFFFGASHSVNYTNTLRPGDAFNASSRLVSQNGIFCLSFRGSFLEISYNCSNYEDHPLWTANRYEPVANDSALSLTIEATGDLKISHRDGDPIVLYNGSSSSSSGRSLNGSVMAVLENSGNFVLKEADSSNGGSILWESFDYPTDTLLPGMKLGINHRTGRKWQLLSWLADDNRMPGAFTMDWEPRERQLIIRRRGVAFWRSGVEFDNIPLLDPWNSNYKFNVVSNVNEDYISYYLNTDPELLTPPDRATLSKWFLNYKGDVIETAGRVYMLFSDNCDGYSTVMGCQRWDVPECRRVGDRFLNQRRSGFFKKNNGLPLIYDYGTKVGNSNTSFIDCKEMCWKNCSCAGFLNSDDLNSTSCTIFTGTFDNKDLTGSEQIYYIILPAPPLHKYRIWIWVVIAVGISAMVALMSILVYLRYRRLKLEEKFLRELTTADRASDANELENTGNKGNNLQVYKVSSITAATNGFSMKNKLGQGGFGPVYKGKLTEGQEIAVKKLSRRSGQGLIEFKNELILIAKLQHMNLVRLLGFCVKGEEKMLVYEYMPNKSLDSYIFDESRKRELDWKMRFSIIEGIAQGILYLHKYSRLRIIHRDLKASNILLDKDMIPKISDFGMARIFKADEPPSNTNRVVGTYGYMSPEYAMEGIFSTKSDVYSFGVLVLEIVSGKRNQNVYHFDRPLNLVGYAWELWKGNANPLELLDPVLIESASKDQVLRCISVGLLCVEHNSMDRPDMSNVLSMLTTNDIRQLPMPKLPAFYIRGEGVEEEPSASEIEALAPNCSVNYMSLSQMDPR